MADIAQDGAVLLCGAAEVNECPALGGDGSGGGAEVDDEHEVAAHYAPPLVHQSDALETDESRGPESGSCEDE